MVLEKVIGLDFKTRAYKKCTITAHGKGLCSLVSSLFFPFTRSVQTEICTKKIFKTVIINKYILSNNSYKLR